MAAYDRYFGALKFCEVRFFPSLFATPSRDAVPRGSKMPDLGASGRQQWMPAQDEPIRRMPSEVALRRPALSLNSDWRCPGNPNADARFLLGEFHARSYLMYPRQSVTTHTEQLGDEASVYDWANAQVHALNPTAACVWRLCDGATSPDAIAAVLQREMEIAEAEAVVKLTLTELAHRHLLEVPAESRDDRPAPTRRWLLGRGLKAAMLPAVYTILTPSPLEAQSPGGAPTLTGVTPNQGTQGTPSR